ncbi:MAG: ParB N-terminal domain-containing protein [Proteobacteria bacterium]|nr:ParB N-terminal domain-containing protein [Pseudomonadota bacterium]
MNYTEADINISDIDQTDDFYKITTADVDDDLIHSIQSIGLLNRPLLMRKGHAFIIVSGFRRTEALARTGENRLSARILHPDISPLDCLKFSISDNTTQRELNMIENARAVDKLANLTTGAEPFYTLVETFLKLGKNRRLIHKIQSLNSLPEQIKTIILKEQLDFSIASELVGYPESDLTAIAIYLDTLKLSLSKQREFLTLIAEISRRENISVQEFLNEPDLKAIIQNNDLEGNQKAGKIRIYLKKRRYPSLTGTEERFIQLVKELKLNPNTKVSPPRYFEGSVFSLTMNFSSLAELIEQKESFDQLIRHPITKKLVDKDFY